MFDIKKYQKLIAAVDNSKTAHSKGSSFESLCEYLFLQLRGVNVEERDIDLPAEEIDLVLWNAQVEDELRPLDPVIFVECKNWSSPAGAPVLDSFIGKLRRRSLKCGIFIAANGVTGTFNSSGDSGARGIISSALQEGIRVITFTMDDLRNVTSTDDVKSLIKRRFCGVFVGKLIN